MFTVLICLLTALCVYLQGRRKQKLRLLQTQAGLRRHYGSSDVLSQVSSHTFTHTIVVITEHAYTSSPLSHVRYATTGPRRRRARGPVAARRASHPKQRLPPRPRRGQRIHGTPRANPQYRP